MTKKDYILIAQAISKARSRAESEGLRDIQDMADFIVDDLSDSFKTENVNFDRTRFWNACK